MLRAGPTLNAQLNTSFTTLLATPSVGRGHPSNSSDGGIQPCSGGWGGGSGTIEGSARRGGRGEALFKRNRGRFLSLPAYYCWPLPRAGFVMGPVQPESLPR